MIDVYFSFRLISTFDFNKSVSLVIVIALIALIGLIKIDLNLKIAFLNDKKC